MSEVSANLEDAAKALGIDISDTPPTDTATQDNFDDPADTPNDGEIQQEPQDTPPQDGAEPADGEPQDTPPSDGEGNLNVSEDVDESSLDTGNEPSEDELREVALNVVGEMLGMEGLSLEQLSEIINKEPEQPQELEIDDRLKPILDFVEKTGRSPEDWFRYQQLNPSEMDDLSAVRLSIQNEYPDLTANEVDRLVNRKYKLDPDRFDAEEIADSELQLKIDATKARKDISSLRENFTLPVENATPGEVESPFDESWYTTMQQETAALEQIEFELPGGKSFNYGVRDDYKQTLIDKNSRLEEFFDQYVDPQGSWDYDKLNMHQAVVDNIDEIVKSVYQQGISDGQRKVVSNASNAQASSPSSVPQQGGKDPQLERLMKELGGSNGIMTIKGL